MVVDDFKKVQVRKDQEKAQSEKYYHFKLIHTLILMSPIRHFQLSMRYDIGYTRNFNRFLGGISRLSNIVGDNPILLVPVHDQMCLITFVPCFISSSEGI